MENFALLHSYTDIGLLILRCGIALIFFVHGLWKIQNGNTMAKNMGKSESGWMFTLLGWVEFAAAAALVMGLFTQIAAIILSLIMAGAIYLKIEEWKVPFTSHDKTGWEFDLMILAGCLLVIFEGAGKIALDKTFFALY